MSCLDLFLCNRPQIIWPKSELAKEVVRDCVPPDVAGVDEGVASDLIDGNREVAAVLGRVGLKDVLASLFFDSGYVRNKVIERVIAIIRPR